MRTTLLSNQVLSALVKVDVPADWKNAVDEGGRTRLNPGCESCPSFVFKTLHNQSIRWLWIFLYPHLSLVTQMVYYLLSTAKFENAVQNCSFQNGYQKTVIQSNPCSFVCPHSYNSSNLWQLGSRSGNAAPEHSLITIPCSWALLKTLQFRYRSIPFRLL